MLACGQVAAKPFQAFEGVWIGAVIKIGNARGICGIDFKGKK
jgi:hypothetical protein